MNQTTNYFNPNKSRKRNIPLADKIELAKRVPQMYTQPRGQVLNSHRSILSPPYMDMDAYTLNLRFSCLGLNSTKEKRKESKVEKQLPVTNNTSNNRVCSNCGTNESSNWRTDLKGKTVCNACGLYLKVYKKIRPPQLWGKKSKKRNRGVKGLEVFIDDYSEENHKNKPSSTMRGYENQSSETSEYFDSDTQTDESD